MRVSIAWIDLYRLARPGLSGFHRHGQREGRILQTFAAWQELASALAGKLTRVTGRRVAKVVIHPGELEEWARRRGRAVDARVRSDFAGTLWRTQNAYVADPDFRMRMGGDWSVTS